MLEVEVKVKCSHRDVVRILNDLGFARCLRVYEKDVYFNSTVLDLKKEDKALRIREYRDLDTGKAVYQLNYKGPKMDTVTMTRMETEFEIPSFRQGNDLLNGLGYSASGIVEKTRIHYEKEDICCCLDLVTGLGEFLEIEIMKEDEAEYTQAMDKIRALLSKLGLKVEDTIRTSYLSMLEGWE